MTQPRYAPITEGGEVRPAYRLAPPAPWLPHRAAELRGAFRADRPGTGVPGPDQGYALLLAHRLAPRLGRYRACSSVAVRPGPGERRPRARPRRLRLPVGGSAGAGRRSPQRRR